MLKHDTNVGDIVFVTRLHPNADEEDKKRFENKVYRVVKTAGKNSNCTKDEILVKNCPVYIHEWVKLADSSNVITSKLLKSLDEVPPKSRQSA